MDEGGKEERKKEREGRQEGKRRTAQVPSSSTWKLYGLLVSSADEPARNYSTNSNDNNTQYAA